MTSERREDDGVVSIAYFQDNQGNPVGKEEAKQIEIVILNEDEEPISRVIMRQ